MINIVPLFLFAGPKEALNKRMRYTNCSPFITELVLKSNLLRSYSNSRSIHRNFF